MKLQEYIDRFFSGNNSEFARQQGTTKQQVNRWIKDNFIVIDDELYSPRRSLKRSKYVICYSGGLSSALCAIETVKKYGNENVILLNHDISSDVENADIKRFKQQVADYLGISITYANHQRWETATPIDICADLGGWKFGNGKILCTYELKTKPFYEWLKINDPEKINTYIYGFDNDPKERARAQRRSQILGQQGYKTEFPLISWERTITNTTEIGIDPPLAYERFKHANCAGCLKAGFQHWYIVFCTRPDIWQKAKDAEYEIGFSIHKDHNGPVYLEDKEEFFIKMRDAGIEPTEHMNSQTFWSIAKRTVNEKKINVDENQIDWLTEHDAGVCLDCTI